MKSYKHTHKCKLTRLTFKVAAFGGNYPIYRCMTRPTLRDDVNYPLWLQQTKTRSVIVQTLITKFFGVDITGCVTK